MVEIYQVMLTQNLVLAAVGTFIFYNLNNRQGWYFLNDVQYALIFVGLALGMSLVEKFHGFSTQKAVAEFAEQMGLVDNPTLDEAIADPHGKQVEACYHTPFKVIRTQYGDRGLLAGYNEHVEAFQQGGINRGNPDLKIYVDCMEEGGQLGVEEEKVKNV